MKRMALLHKYPMHNCGEIWYYDAKNITYIDTEGNEDYFLVWKAEPDKYPFFHG